MDVSRSWTAHDWFNRGGELLENDPWLAKRLIARGLQVEPNESIAWFNLGIGLHQQRRIAAAVRAYRHCLALPHNKATAQAARNNLAQDLLLLGRWHEGWSHYAQRFTRKPGNYPLFENAFGPSHRGPLKEGQTVLLMSEQGFGDTLQFSRYALLLQRKGFDVTLLSQPALVPILRESVGLKNVVAKLEIRAWTEKQAIWLPLLDILPILQSQEQWAPFSNGYLNVDSDQIKLWSKLLQRTPGKRLIALHWQGNPEHEQSIYSRKRSVPFECLQALSQLPDVNSSLFKRVRVANNAQPTMY